MLHTTIFHTISFHWNTIIHITLMPGPCAAIWPYRYVAYLTDIQRCWCIIAPHASGDRNVQRDKPVMDIRLFPRLVYNIG